MYELLERWRVIIKNFLLKHTSNFPVNARVVDIGYGDSAVIFKKRFPSLEIIDHKVTAQTLTTHIVDICDSIPENLVDAYDLVGFCETLEHTQNPFIAAENVIKLARPKGIILLTVPCRIFYHPMMPLCGDYWRFFGSSIPILFKGCVVKEVNSYYETDPPQKYDMPLGVTAVLQKIGETK